MERRGAKRMAMNLPLVVHGTDMHGKDFEEMTTSINISSVGVFLLLHHNVSESSELVVSVIPPLESGGPLLGRFTARGRVLRREALGSPSKSTYLAIQFTEKLHLNSRVVLFLNTVNVFLGRNFGLRTAQNETTDKRRSVFIRL